MDGGCSREQRPRVGLVYGQESWTDANTSFIVPDPPLRHFLFSGRYCGEIDAAAPDYLVPVRVPREQYPAVFIRQGKGDLQIFIARVELSVRQQFRHVIFASDFLPVSPVA